MKLTGTIALLACLAALSAAASADAPPTPRVLTNHLGYERYAAKKALVRSHAGDRYDRFEVRTWPEGTIAYAGEIGVGAPVDKWKSWVFWSMDFTDLQLEGEYVLHCYDGDRVIRSVPFRIQRHILERHTLSDAIYWFKTQRASGFLDKADRNVPLRDGNARIDAHGGWYDATGDYGKHFTQLSGTSYFNTQQIPLTAWSLFRALEILTARDDVNFDQMRRRLLDEALYGADYLVRFRDPKASFYQSVMGPGPGKKPEDRRVGNYESRVGNQQSYRAGAGLAIAALAMAARQGEGLEHDPAAYRKAAEDSFDYLEAHNVELTNDKKENMVDDYCALVAATELYKTTRNPRHFEAATKRASSLLSRLTPEGYWRVDDKDRPFFSPSDAGLPVVSLLGFHEMAPAPLQERILDVVRRSMAWELQVTREVANPFGYARQLVQHKDGKRNTAFFFPHDTETAPWWQGENARLGSLAYAARVAASYFPDDSALQARLRAYAVDQLDWILGLNPYDASMLGGTGRNNPEYIFLGTWQYENAPGGVVNGITSGMSDEHDIDYNVGYETTGQDHDWRWMEQWLPHTSWYMLAAAAGDQAVPPRASPKKVVIGYVFPQDRVLDPAAIAAGKLTHVNYAFADIKNGRMVEGFRNDAANFRVLNGLKAKNPELKVLVSVGGWTWSGGFSDVSLSPQSRKVFVESAVAYVDRHGLDGLDVDWEYPAMPGYGNVNRPEDKQNFTLLLADLRAGLDGLGARKKKRLLLTIAVGALDACIQNSEMDKASRYLDYVNLMAYDQYGAGVDEVTGHHAPLFDNPKNPKKQGANTMVDRFVAAGVPEHKMVLGVPFYGKGWGGVRDKDHGLYQPGARPKERFFGSFTNLKNTLENKDGFVRYWDESAQAPYLYNASTGAWFSYEDEESLAAKCRYVRDRGIAGVMFWELRGDDGRLLDVIQKGLFPAEKK